MPNLNSMSTSDLQKLAKQNSANWHDADKTTQNALHQQNVEINKILDSRSGSSTTFDSGTGTWKSSGGSSGGGSSGFSGGSGASSYTNSGYGSYNANPSYDYSAALGELLRSGSTDYDTLEKLINERTAKALSTANLNKYANDTFAQSVRDYIAAGRADEQAAAEKKLQEARDADAAFWESQLAAMADQNNSSYAQALAQQQAANEAAVQRAVNSLEGQKGELNNAYSDLYRQAYVDRMNAQKNIGQRLAAQGITGGAAESTLLGLNTAYSDALRRSEQERLSGLSDIDRAISDAQLTGDITNAQATADAIREQAANSQSILQTLLDRYDRLSAQRAETERADAQSTQSWARQMALSMLDQGVMPDDDTLTSAGMTRAQASALLPQTATSSYSPTFSQAQVINAANAAAKSGSALSGNMLRDYNWYMYGDPDYGSASGSASGTVSAKQGTTPRVSYNNGGLSNSEVAAIQRAFGLDADGYWGPNSQSATGYASAADAAKAVQASQGGGTGTMTSSEAIIAAANASSTQQGQLQYLNQLYQQGRITQQQRDDIAYAIVNPSK